MPRSARRARDRSAGSAGRTRRVAGLAPPARARAVRHRSIAAHGPAPAASRPDRAGMIASIMAAVSVEEAFAYCEARTKAHYENFPVGLFVPRRAAALRLRALRLRARGRRLRRRADLRGRARARSSTTGSGCWTRPIAARPRGRSSSRSARRCGGSAIPKQLLLDLLSAFRQDVEKTRYQSWDELLDYCRRSANPVGRLVLLVFEQQDETLPPLSDAVCTALQLANHWQDAAIDYARGRVYVPEELLRRHGVTDWDFSTGRVSDGWRGLMGELIGAHARAVRAGPAALRPRRPRAALRAAPHLARRHVDPRPDRGGRRRRVPAAGRSMGALDKAALACAPGAGARHERRASGRASRAGAAPTSTTRSACCRAEKRRRALRALRLLPGGRRLRRRGGRRGRGGPAALARGGRTAATPAGPRPTSGSELAEAVARFPVPRALPRGHRRRLPDGPRRRGATRPSRELRLYCERVASAVGLASIEIFGYDDPRHARLRRRARSRAAAHEHPARRRRRRGARPDLPPARGPGALRRERGRSCCAAARDRPRPRPAGPRRPARVRGGARTLALRGGGRAAARERDRRSMLAAEIMGAVYRALLEEWIAARAAGRRAEGVAARRRAQGLDRAAHDPARRTGAYEGRRVGGGFAGLAAAIALQERRHEVVLLERRGVLGGRATSSRDAVTGEDVDNGTHLMVGAYRSTLDLVRRAGAERPAARAGAACVSSGSTSRA